MSTVQVEMTAEQFARYKEAMQAQEERDRKKQAKENRDAYRSLAATTVDTLFPRLESASNTLTELKREVYDTFDEVIKMKTEVMGVASEGQRTHSIMDTEGNRRIIVGYYIRDGWDETVDDGIAKVKAYLLTLAGDEESRKLVEIILDLLSRDGKGNLKAEKVLQLDKYAEGIKDAQFLEGVAIIKEAYRPVRTKDFVRAQKKIETGKWKEVPLGITEA